MAKSCGRRVEVLGLRSETDQVFVNPSGGMTLEQSVQPRWARKLDGSWAAVDTSLRVAADGSVVPAATPVPVVFSGGGQGPFATIADGGRSLSVSWPGDRLPRPALSGDTATYREVMPGVDLRVTASATGFSQYLVVKTRTAAASPALARVGFGLATKGLTAKPVAGGGLEALDGQGRTVFTSPTPMMWDSGSDGTAVASRGAGVAGLAATQGAPAAPKRRWASMPVRVSGGKLTISPDRGLLTDPKAALPLIIDPSWTGRIAGNAWTSVWSRSDVANSSFWQNNSALNNASTKGGAGSGRTCDSSSGGSCTSTPYLIRSLFRMDLSGVQGKQITGAKFRVQQQWSWTCNPASNAKLWITGAISPSTTWNNQPVWDGNYTASALANHRADRAASCAGTGDVEFNATGLVQHAIASGWPDLTLGLRAADEGTINQWKRFNATTPVLAIDYNTLPNMPDGLTVDGKACVSGAGRPFVATASPTLRAHVTDPDGDSLQTWFAYAKWDTAQNKFVDVGGGHQDSVPNGGTGQIPTSGLVDGGIYTFRAQTNDGHGGVSPVTHVPGKCEWQVDLTDPAVPNVTGDVYTENSAGCPVDGCGSVGQTGGFTFASSPDIASYRWGFSDPPSTTVTPGSVGGSVTVTWTPATGGPRTLYVKAIDRAGRSATKAYQFTVAGPAPAVARWRLGEPAGATDLADETGNGHTATLTGGTLGVPGRIVGGDTALSLAGDSGSQAQTAGPLIDTSRSFSVSAWVKLAATSSSWSLVEQPGNNVDAFALEYNNTADAWKLALSATDTSTPAWSGPTSVTRPVVNVWTHLVGVYDADAKQARLYVNGSLEGTAGSITAWNGAGKLYLGRTGSASKGSLSDVQVWNRMISPAEITALSDPMAVGGVGEWRMDEVGNGPAFDSSGMGHDLTFHPIATIPPSGSGHTGTGLHLDGISGYADTEGPVLYTDQSFTVSAWVRLGDADAGTPAPDLPTGNRTAVGQSGQFLSGFFLGYRVMAGVPRWDFGLKNTDSDDGAWVNAPSSAAVTTADVGRWVHLVGVFDAGKATVKLYVDGALASSVPRAAAWHAGGPFTIGAALWSPVGGPPRLVDCWNGDIDEVRAFAGVLPDPAVANLARGTAAAATRIT
jgi:hypothetical protein